jgi:hypothetical protein
LENYLQSLQQLLQHHEETHKIGIQPYNQ